MFLLSSFGAFAQQSVVIKAGTIVPLEALKTIRAVEVHEGETVDFKVSRDVTVDGKTVIPAGTLAKGTVYEVTFYSVWYTWTFRYKTPLFNSTIG